MAVTQVSMHNAFSTLARLAEDIGDVERQLAWARTHQSVSHQDGIEIELLCLKTQENVLRHEVQAAQARGYADWSN